MNELHKVLNYFADLGYNKRYIYSRNRSREIADIRFIIWRYLYESGWTYMAIAEEFGKDHSTIIHGVKQASTIREITQEYDRLRDTIQTCTYHSIRDDKAMAE